MVIAQLGGLALGALFGSGMSTAAQAMARGAMYKDFERHAYEETCNLFKQEVK